MATDVMPILSEIQRMALDPATDEKTLRDLLIKTLDLCEKNEDIIRRQARIIATTDEALDNISETINEQGC